MKFTKVDKKIQKTLQDALVRTPHVKHIVKDISAQGGRALLVGGAVRDLLLNKPVHDLDIEVHYLSLEKLEKILKKYGPVSLVGKAYGVLRLHGLDIDWSIPRTDSKGRKPKVIIDPQMSFKDAFRRRDLTINAMGIDLITRELIDPFHGLTDLEKKRLRAPDKERFVEDPLRFYRVMQFIGRFTMVPDRSLSAICKKMNLKNISVERIDAEFKKLFLQSEYPSLAFRWLKKLSRLRELFPELAATIGIKQNKQWHPEGDVFEHTMQSLDAAAHLTYHNEYEKLLVMYAALAHDLGKSKTTRKTKGQLHSYGHSEVGVTAAKKLLKRMTKNKELTDAVCKLVAYHMMPGQLVDNKASLSAYKRLAKKLAPDVTMEQLALLALADKQGRSSIKGKPLTKKFKDIEIFLKKAKQAHVLTTAVQPILQGRDLMGIVPPGPEMGKLLKKAYELQIEEGIEDKEVLKKRILSH